MIGGKGEGGSGLQEVRVLSRTSQPEAAEPRGNCERRNRGRKLRDCRQPCRRMKLHPHKAESTVSEAMSPTGLRKIS